MPISTNHSFFPYAVHGTPAYEGPNPATYSVDATSTTAVWYTETDGVSRLVYNIRNRNGSALSAAEFRKLVDLVQLVKWSEGSDSFQARVVDANTTTQTISISIDPTDPLNQLPTTGFTFAGSVIVGGLDDWPHQLAGFDNDHIELGYPVTTDIIADNSIRQGVTENVELQRIVRRRAEQMVPFIRRHVIQTTDVTDTMWPVTPARVHISDASLSTIPGVAADEDNNVPAIPDVPVYTVKVNVEAVAASGNTPSKNIFFDITFANPSYTEMNVAKGVPSYSDVTTENAFTFTITNESDAPINKNITEVVEVDNTHTTSTELQKVFDISNTWNVGINSTIGYGAPGITSGAFGSVSVNTAFGGETNTSRTSTNSSSNEAANRKTRTLSDTVILQPLSLYQMSATYRKATVSRTDTFRGNVDFVIGIHNLNSNNTAIDTAIGDPYVQARASTKTYHGLDAASSTWRWAFGTSSRLIDLPETPVATFPAGTISEIRPFDNLYTEVRNGYFIKTYNPGYAIVLGIPKSAPDNDDGSWSVNYNNAANLVRGQEFTVAGATGAQASKYNGTWKVRDVVRIGDNVRVYIEGTATRYNALNPSDTVVTTGATINLTRAAETQLDDRTGAGVSLRLSGASNLNEWMAAVMKVDAAVAHGDSTTYESMVNGWFGNQPDREELLRAWLYLKSSELQGVEINRNITFTDATDVSLQVSKIASLFYGEINPDDATDDTTGYIPFQPTFSQSLIPTFSDNTQDVENDANGGTAGNPGGSGGTINTPGTGTGINGDGPNAGTA